jgi:hypothetical protein
MPKTNSDDPVVHLAQLSASHTADLYAERGAPCEYTCGIAEGAIYKITIEPSWGERTADDASYPTRTLENGKTINVWDQVFIANYGEEGKGTWCGNRCGGRDTLAGLYADTIRKAVLEQLKEAA